MTGKGVVRSVKNLAKGYNDIQIKVREATSNDAWGPSGTLMNEIAQSTNNAQDFIVIMDMIDKRLNDKGKNWRHVFKALLLMDYCLHVGSENVILYAKENIYVIKTLKDFQHIDENGRDVGANVRQKAKDVANLLSDDNRLRDERRQRQQMRDRMAKIGNAGALDDDGDLQKALEESKRLAEEEEKRRSQKDEDDMNLAIALERSEREAKEMEQKKEERDKNQSFDMIFGGPQTATLVNTFDSFSSSPSMMPNNQAMTNATANVNAFPNNHLAGPNTSPFMGSSSSMPYYSQPAESTKNPFNPYAQQQQQQQQIQLQQFQQQQQFQPQPQPQWLQPQQADLHPQLTGLQAQLTGHPPQLNGLQPQMTGFQPQQTGIQPQQTGLDAFSNQMVPFQSSNNPYLQPQITGASQQNMYHSSPAPSSPSKNPFSQHPTTASAGHSPLFGSQDLPQSMVSSTSSTFSPTTATAGQARSFTMPLPKPKSSSTAPQDPRYEKLNALLASREDGMDTFGNTGDLRIPVGTGFAKSNSQPDPTKAPLQGAAGSLFPESTPQTESRNPFGRAATIGAHSENQAKSLLELMHEQKQQATGTTTFNSGDVPVYQGFPSGH